MFKKLEQLSDRMLNRLVPATTASASCPCGSYPYTGPCYYYRQCSSGGSRPRFQQCLCENSAAKITCGPCLD
jgi:hypothetical protein